MAEQLSRDEMVDLGRKVSPDCHHDPNTWCNHAVAEFLDLLAERGMLADQSSGDRYEVASGDAWVIALALAEWANDQDEAADEHEAFDPDGAAELRRQAAVARGVAAGETSGDTGAERYLAERLRDPEYRAAYESARGETSGDGDVAWPRLRGYISRLRADRDRLAEKAGAMAGYALAMHDRVEHWAECPAPPDGGCGECHAYHRAKAALAAALSEDGEDATPVVHGMVPGSHERMGGPECRCGRRWSRWDEECFSEDGEDQRDHAPDWDESQRCRTCLMTYHCPTCGAGVGVQGHACAISGDGEDER